MSPDIVPLDVVTRTAPLGVRFRDAVFGTVVRAGLVVTATPLNGGRTVEGFVNRSGVWVLQGLPGLRDVENGAGDDAYWAAPPQRRTFLVEVADGEGRYLPFTFRADLPHKGLFTLPCAMIDSPPSPGDAVPIFAAHTRAAAAGMAVIRAELFDAASRKPASWALLEARSAGRLLARGYADKGGSAALYLPWPEPQHYADVPAHSPPLSPAGPSSTPLTSQSWLLQLTAAFSPALRKSDAPDLCDVLAQPPAVLFADDAFAPLPEQRLRYGQELVARTLRTSDGTLLSQLYLTPGGSPL